MTSESRTKNREARAARTRENRQRIVSVATELFVRDGYLQTTMADIARAAGVAVQTLYLSFGSKAAVLSAAMDIAIVGDDDPVPVIERSWYSQVRDEPQAAKALSAFTRIATEVIVRFYPLYATMRAAAADPEVAELLEKNKHQRFATFEQVMHDIAAKSGWDPQLTTKRAAEIVYALESEETYGLLVVEHGWTVADWSAWIDGQINWALFAR